MLFIKTLRYDPIKISLLDTSNIDTMHSRSSPLSFLLTLLFVYTIATLANAQVYDSAKLHRTTTTSASTSRPPPAPTSVWATGLLNGATTVTLSPFTQVFKPMYSTVQVPKAGSIGLGTISGTVGIVKPPAYKTVSLYTAKVS